MTIDPQGLSTAQLAELSEVAGERLITLGERALKVGRELMLQAGHLNSLVMAELPDDYSIGTNGVVTESVAIKKAVELKRFTRAQFGEALGLKGAALSKWLNKLSNRANPVITRDGDRFTYVQPPDTAPKSRPRVTPPEVALVGAQISNGRQPVEGTGRKMKVTDPEIAELINAIHFAGGTVKRVPNGHYEVTYQGKSAQTSATPGDHRSVLNARSYLRRRLGIRL